MIEVNTKISQVTVYPSNAMIVRTGKVDLPSGQNVLEVQSLPIRLNPDSVRVKGFSKTKTQIEGIEIKKISHRTISEPDEGNIEKLRLLQYDREKISHRIEFYEKKRENNEMMEEKLSEDFPRLFARGKISIDDISALRATFKDDYNEVLDEIPKLKEQKLKLDREIEILQNKLGDKDLPRRPDDYTLLVSVNNISEKKDDFQLEFNYVISNVRWYPLYDFRVDSEKKEVVIDYFGVIEQITGEEWEDIELILSTAKPTVVTTIPKLHPWYVDVYRPPEARPPPSPASISFGGGPPAGAPKRRSRGIMYEKSMMRDEAVAQVVEESVQITAQAETVGEAQVYKIPKKETITSDRKPHRVLISQINNPLKIDFISVPISMNDVIRRGKITNESKFIFLSGEVRIFDGNEYIGKTRIPQISPKEKFTFAIGVTNAIKIKRKVSSSDVSKKGMLSKSKLREFEIEIEIENNREEISTIEIHDRLPKSKHEDIKVTIESVVPEPFKKPTLNVYKWKLDVKPQTKEKIIQKYDVEYPLGLSISGI